MSEIVQSLSETQKKSWILSPKVRKILEIFSLSVWLIISWNTYAWNEDNTYLNLEQKTQKSDAIFNELKYAFIEKNSWLILAIIEKLKDEWNFEKSLTSDLKYIQDDITVLFSLAIKKNWLTLEYNLNNEIINKLSYIKTHLEILMNIRYWKWYCDIFDWKDHSNSNLKIIFKKMDNWYIIENLYIIRSKT